MPQKSPSTRTVPLDEKDVAILRALQSDAKQSVREIAQGVHLTTTPVHERIKRMEEEGVIQGYSAVIDFTKIRKELLVICSVSLRTHSKASGRQFIEAIHGFPEVLECYNISGEFDFLLKVAVEDMEGYYDFHVNKLSQVENVGHLQSVFVMGTVKHSPRPL